MIRTLMLVGALLSMAAHTHAQTAASSPAPIVFFSVFGPDGARLQRFYADVFGWPVTAEGAVTVNVTAPLSGQIDRSVNEPPVTMLYIGVADVTASLEKVKAHGGTVQAARFEVPGRVVLGLFADPAGNRVGLVEMENGRAKVPGAR